MILAPSIPTLSDLPGTGGELARHLLNRFDLTHVKVEVTDGHLTISGERQSETEEEKDDIYRCERSYGCGANNVSYGSRTHRKSPSRCAPR